MNFNILRFSRITTIFVGMVFALVIAFIPATTQASQADERLFAKFTSDISYLLTRSAEAPVMPSVVADPRVENIRSFFAQWDLPAADYAEDFVYYADLYEIDPYLVASIAFNESTGFKFTCGYNAFGWRIYPGQGCEGKGFFTSFSHAIQVVSYNLAGNNPNTEHFYKGKDLVGIINTYNPPSVNPKYEGHILNTIKKMKAQNA